MHSSIKTFIAMLFLVITFTSCNQEPTLQTYIIDHELSPGFISGDIPMAILNVDKYKDQLTSSQLEAYNSIDKINFIAFTLDGNNAKTYDFELAQVNTILKAEKYQELIRGGNSIDGRFTVKFLGDLEAIDELIIAAQINDKGFIVARVLGNQMNAAKLLTLQSVLKYIDLKDDKLTMLSKFF